MRQRQRVRHQHESCRQRSSCCQSARKWDSLPQAQHNSCDEASNNVAQVANGEAVNTDRKPRRRQHRHRSKRGPSLPRARTIQRSRQEQQDQLHRATLTGRVEGTLSNTDKSQRKPDKRRRSATEAGGEGGHLSGDRRGQAVTAARRTGARSRQAPGRQRQHRQMGSTSPAAGRAGSPKQCAKSFGTSTE